MDLMNSLATVLSSVFYEFPPTKIGGSDDWFEQSLKRAHVTVCDPAEHFQPSPHANHYEYHSPYYEVASLAGRQLPPDRMLTFQQIRTVFGIGAFTECANTHELLSFAEHHPKKMHEIGTLFSVGRDEFSAYRFGSMLVSHGRHFLLRRVDLCDYPFRRNARFLFRCTTLKEKEIQKDYRFVAVPS